MIRQLSPYHGIRPDPAGTDIAAAAWQLRDSSGSPPGMLFNEPSVSSAALQGPCVFRPVLPIRRSGIRREKTESTRDQMIKGPLHAEAHGLPRGVVRSSTPWMEVHRSLVGAGLQELD
jgi:hypothetical protein